MSQRISNVVNGRVLPRGISAKVTTPKGTFSYLQVVIDRRPFEDNMAPNAQALKVELRDGQGNYLAAAGWYGGRADSKIRPTIRNLWATGWWPITKLPAEIEVIVDVRSPMDVVLHLDFIS